MTEALNQTMKKFEINTPLKQAMFLATGAQESGEFKYVQELPSKQAEVEKNIPDYTRRMNETMQRFKVDTPLKQAIFFGNNAARINRIVRDDRIAKRTRQ